MSKKLTKRDIDAFVYQGGWDVRWDASLSGFGVRLYPSGKKTYVLSYRHGNRKHLMALGQVSKITLDMARNLALKNLAELAGKNDPLAERKKKSVGRTVEVIFSEFLERYAKPKNRSWQETERIFKTDVFPAIGKKAVQDVTKQDIIKLIDKVVDRGSPTMANRTLAHVRKFFNWCVGRDLIQVSPVFKIPKPSPETTRDRVLGNDEIRIIWQDCNVESYPFGSLVQIALLTAQRRMEVATMRWQDIDMKHKIWMLPATSTKSNRRNEIPLSASVLEILESLPRHNKGDYIFSADGERPFANFGRGKRSLDKIIADRTYDTDENKNAVSEWRLHDLRRTAASGMAGLGVSPHVVERILNHSSGIISGVAAVYNRYDYRDEMRDALEKWANKIVSLTE